MKTLLALHGFTGESADFTALKAHLPSDTILRAPDFPGHGAHRLQRNPLEYTMDAHLATIDRAADGAKVTLLGYSMGGRLALHWALAHPEQVERLILVGASPGLATAEAQAERRLADETLADFIRTRGLEAFFKYWHNQTFFQTMLALPPEELAPILGRRSGNDPEGLALSLRHVGTGSLPSLWPRLKEIRCPVDLVTGETDAKFTRLAQEMGAHLAKARHSVIEGAGHAVHLERPGDLAMLVR
jgi:2-succinyl-6-hydroxy-2,4-cyclohexadiene-1-carboxylate synthase